MTTQAETLCRTILETLNEPNKALIQQVITVIGVERAQEFFWRAQAVEANGGLVTASKKRRRTPGGVFFPLVRKGVSKAERKLIFPKDKAEPRVRTRKPSPVPIAWEEAEAQLTKLLAQAKPGSATIQMRLIGRPKRVARARTCIVCEMEGDAPPQLPKGLPILLPDLKPTIGVFLSYDHWARVEDKLLDFPENQMIIDGWPYIDAARNFFGLFAQNVTVREFPHLPPEIIRRVNADDETKADEEPA
jgi:PHAX RNA-binding domain